MAQSVRIWVKKRFRMDLLTFPQQEMVKLGLVGNSQVKGRLSRGQNATDGPARPLQRGYYGRKLRRGLPGVRDLTFTGKMLQNLTLRTVTEKSAKAALTSRIQRVKGWSNMRREAWLVFSPVNRKAIVVAAKQIFAQVTSRGVFFTRGN